MTNLPEDWNSYWDVCPEHGVKHHMSEGCPICDLSEEEEKAWYESKEDDENDMLDQMEFDKADYEPQDHPEW